MSFTEKFLRPVAIATLFLTAFAARADYSGTVFVDSNANGVLDNGEKPLKGVAVSDGLNVVKTDAKGHFTLPGFDRERFVFITTPSGYLTHNRHYIAISPEVKSYDFGLIPYDARITRDGKHSFIQVTDTEIFNTSSTKTGWTTCAATPPTKAWHSSFTPATSATTTACAHTYA